MKKKSLSIVFTFSILTVLIILCIAYFVSQGGGSLFAPNSRVKNVLILPNEENTIKRKDPVDLAVYFYGANCDETWIATPFAAGGLNLTGLKDYYRKDLVFVSFGYDTRFHWSSPDIAKDSIKSIRQVCKKYNVRKIMLIGVSAGGSLALNVLSLADKKLQNQISGVIAVFPIIDYEYTLLHSQRENIIYYLSQHFSKYKDPNQMMRLSSPITYVSRVPDHTKIILIEGTKDTHVGSNQIEKYYSQLIKDKKNAELIKYNVDHLLVELDKEFGDIVKSLLK